MVDKNVSSVKRRPHAIYFDESTMTKQSFKDECDINNLIARYRKTGTLTHVNSGQGDYGDFTNIGSYQDACVQVIAAQEAFMALPSAMRARFANDPGQFLDFVDNPANKEELVKMGLLAPEVVQKMNTGDQKNSTAREGGTATPVA